MSENQNQPITLTSVIAAAMKLPGIRVDREAFLREQFKDEDPVAMNTILAVHRTITNRDPQCTTH